MHESTRCPQPPWLAHMPRILALMSTGVAATRVEPVVFAVGQDRLAKCFVSGVRDEACTLGIDVPVAHAALPVCVEPLRHHQMKVVLRARHRDIEEAALFLDFRRRPGGEIGRQATVHGVEQEYRGPLLALGRMDRRQDQVVLVLERHAGFIAGRVRRIERQLGEKALAARVAPRDMRQLVEVGFANGGVLVFSLEMRCVPAAEHIELGRPAGGIEAQGGDGRLEILPVLARRRPAA